MIGQQKCSMPVTSLFVSPWKTLAVFSFTMKTLAIFTRNSGGWEIQNVWRSIAMEIRDHFVEQANGNSTSTYGHIISYYIYTLRLFNIAMENCPFIDDFPIKTSIYKGFSMAMLVITRGYIYIYIVRGLVQRNFRISTCQLANGLGREYSEKSDMWSLGMVLYAMCFTSLPFSHDDPHAARPPKTPPL